jgi:hypothetical protein
MDDKNLTKRKNNKKIVRFLGIDFTADEIRQIFYLTKKIAITVKQNEFLKK